MVGGNIPSVSENITALYPVIHALATNHVLQNHPSCILRELVGLLFQIFNLTKNDNLSCDDFMNLMQFQIYVLRSRRVPLASRDSYGIVTIYVDDGQLK